MEGFTVTSAPLPSGDHGTRKTVAAMRQLVATGARDVTLRAAVLRVLRARATRDHDVAAQLRAWFEFVRDAIKFVHDPVGGEWLQSPRYTLELGAGDCDDRAVLLAAGLQAFGVRTSFKVVALDPARPDSFSHVYVVAHLGGRDVPLDPTYRDTALGAEPFRPTRTWMVPA